MEKRYIAYVRMVSKYASTLFPVKVSKRGERNSNVTKHFSISPIFPSPLGLIFFRMVYMIYDLEIGT